MGKRSDYKKHSEFAAWDMDKGCRGIVNQHSPGRRRLRKRLMRQARRRMMFVENTAYEYDPCEDCVADDGAYFTNDDGELECFCPQCPVNLSRLEE